ncbi:MAG: GNAT family N-acetyltransferase [Acidobacteriota bacterium]
MQAARLRLSSKIKILEISERSQFQELEKDWDVLVAATQDQPFYRHEFIRIWIDNFAPRAQLRIITGRNDQGRLIAALPLMQQQERMYGLSVQQLVSTANPHSCRCDLIAEDGEASGRAIFAHLAADKSWDLLRIQDVPEGGNAWHILQAAQEANYPVGVWESLRSPYIPLSTDYKGFCSHLSAKFQANLRRRRKHLLEKGEFKLARITGGDELMKWLQAAYTIEQSGWKGALGSAIAQDHSTLGFYNDLAQWAATKGYLSLYFLNLANQPIAFHYGLIYRNRYYLPKIGYAESFSDCSPGQLLFEDVIRDCLAHGLQEFDLLGPDMPWKQVWTNKVRPHHWLFIFQKNSLGRLLATAKFKLVPVAKEVMGLWKR